MRSQVRMKEKKNKEKLSNDSFKGRELFIHANSYILILILLSVYIIHEQIRLS